MILFVRGSVAEPEPDFLAGTGAGLFSWNRAFAELSKPRADQKGHVRTVLENV